MNDDLNIMFVLTKEQNRHLQVSLLIIKRLARTPVPCATPPYSNLIPNLIQALVGQVFTMPLLTILAAKQTLAME